MTPENKQWIQDNTWMLISVFFVFFHHTNADPSLAENQCLQSSSTHGTFALALAFAGNDLVNFIGVPSQASRPSSADFTVNGNGNPDGSDDLTARPRQNPWYLIGAGAIAGLALVPPRRHTR